jgi:hypothetical protein
MKAKIPRVCSPPVAAVLLAGATFPFLLTTAQPDPAWLAHDRERPQPPVVDPGQPSTPADPGKPPSDAIVLFDGKDLSAWAAMDGVPTRWVVREGYMECAPNSGYIRTIQNFGDCQLHIEWAAPTPAEGEGQGRGNSGVFFGRDRYELQVLDSYGNRTYADGSAGSVYIQYPPLVNASRPPGQWQTYDIIWTAPRFDLEGKLQSSARITAFHNGVLIQNNVELTGPTGWLQRAPYQPHPEKLPIALQDHGNPVRYRNIWVRPLGKPAKPEFTLSDAQLEALVGDYRRERNDTVRVRRAADGQLSVSFSGATFIMCAESPTRFFAKTTDVTAEFEQSGGDRFLILSVGEGRMRCPRL